LGLWLPRTNEQSGRGAEVFAPLFSPKPCYRNAALSGLNQAVELAIWPLDSSAVTLIVLVNCIVLNPHSETNKDL
jgi:hypothetical protein